MQLKLILALVIIFLGGGLNESINAQASNLMSKEGWEEDIDFLITKMGKIVPDFELKADQRQLDSLVQNLKTKLESYSENQIVIALQEILNQVQDEGCRIYPFQARLNYKVLPLRTYWFKEGVYICDASEKYKSFKGERITAINGVPIDSVYAKLAHSLNADNPHYQQYLFPLYSSIPAWLVGRNLGQHKNHVTLSLASGKETTVFAEEVAEYAKLNRNLASYKQIEGSTVRHDGENYWAEYLEEQKILFIQFLQIRNSPDGKSFKDFVSKLSKQLDKLKVDKIVIDNRYGGGGNGFKLKPFTDMIKEHKTFNQSGKLFVLTSRATRGTILELTSILQLNTKAILVGEPTGEGPNSVGDVTSIELPNSKIEVSLTKKFWPTSWKEDIRTTLHPNIPVNYSFADYSAKVDPWLREVIQYKPTEQKKSNFSAEILSGIAGNHSIGSRKVEFYQADGQLFAKMGRKMMSLFEFHTQVYPDAPGRLSTDIEGLYFTYESASKSSILGVEWRDSTTKLK